MSDRSLQDLRREHSPGAVSSRLAVRSTSTLSDWVLGAVDGAITTFAIMAGVAGAGLSAGVVVVLGVANLVADGLSMAASRFLGARADLERREIARVREHRHIELVPEGEREEVRQLLAAKGFADGELEIGVDVITRDVDTWVDFMLTEELGFAPQPDRPLVAATATFGGFVAFGVLPLLPFIVNLSIADIASPSAWSVGLTAVAFCAVGMLKARVVGSDPIRAALSTLGVGGSAATLAFVIGFLLRDLA